MKKSQARIDRIGETNFNTFNNKMEIIAYTTNLKVTIKFDDGYTIITSYSSFISGKIAHPLDKRVCGVGYMGYGEYTGWSNKIKNPEYSTWVRMFQRCYDEATLKRTPTYNGCTVCEEWHNFQNFAKWYNKNYYKIENEQMHLDKDILVKGNKIYSPETCCFVSERINNLFVKCDKARGELPIGVSYSKKNRNFSCQCRNGSGKNIHLGSFYNLNDAFNAYKIFKESLIRETADKFKAIIPEKLYKAMYNYEVINDLATAEEIQEHLKENK